MAKLEKYYAIKDGKVVFDAKRAEKAKPVNIQLQRKTSKVVRAVRKRR